MSKISKIAVAQTVCRFRSHSELRTPIAVLYKVISHMRLALPNSTSISLLALLLTILLKAFPSTMRVCLLFYLFILTEFFS